MITIRAQYGIFYSCLTHRIFLKYFHFGSDLPNLKDKKKTKEHGEFTQVRLNLKNNSRENMIKYALLDKSICQNTIKSSSQT